MIQITPALNLSDVTSKLCITTTIFITVLTNTPNIMLCTKFHIHTSNSLLVTMIKIKLSENVCKAATLLFLQYTIT